MNTPKLTFGLPAYKAKFFREALDSILAQTFTDFELVIVNDASPENIEEIAKSYSDPRIRYYCNEKNLGGNDLVANWNKVLSYARGEYFVLASDDDIYHPDFAKKLVALLEKYPDVNIAHCRLKCIDENKETLNFTGMCSEHESCLEFIYDRLILHRMQMMPDFMFRTQALRDLGGCISFPLAWYADTATCFAMAKENGVVYAKDVLFSFRYSGINISSAPSGNCKNKLIASMLFYDWIQAFVSGLKQESEPEKQLAAQILKDSLSAILLDANAAVRYEKLMNIIKMYRFFSKENVPHADLVKDYLRRNALRIWVKNFLRKQGKTKI